ncbi:isochorismatase family protein [Streptomyces sp. NPDC053513]|uniref:isochorismatase family protein n=1 Tax=unclassified Streptomyces TaxID=2593676 RepID=UPI0037D52CF9
MPLIDRDDCALVIIDVQTDFYPPHRLDVDRQRFHDMVRRIAWITSVADRLEIPVVVTEEDPAASGHTVPEIREVLPAKAVTLPKNAFAVWDNPDIAAAIEATGRTTMILVGIETDICVAHSAIQLHHAGKRVVVVDDAAYSPGQAHERGLRRLAGRGIETLSTKELFYDWVRTIQDADAFHDTHADLMLPPGVRL